MTPETRSFLAAVRHAEDPSPGDESRVLAALHGALAGGTSVTAAGASGAAKVALASSVSGLKLLTVLALLAAGAAAGSVFVA
ncbi:MAG TPA: hypothetical protein VFZ53_27050, partial [Polyangiaceae bacterium]